MGENDSYPISAEDLAKMLKFGITKDHLDKMLEEYPLEEVVKYVRGSLRSGDDSDEVAGPRIINQ